MSCNFYYKGKAFALESELLAHIEQETKQLKARLVTGNLTFEERNNIENVGAYFIEAFTEAISRDTEFILENDAELKLNFLATFKANTDELPLTDYQKAFNEYVLEEVGRDNSFIWDRIKVVAKAKYLVDTKDLDSFEEGLNSEKDWEDYARLSVSAAKGMDDVKRYINTLDVMVFDENGNATLETNTPTGINNKLDFNNVLGTLIYDLYSEDITDFENNVANLASRIPSFKQLHKDILNTKEHKGLKERLYSKLSKQSPKSVAVFYSEQNNKITSVKTDVENKGSFPHINLSDLWMVNSKNIINRKTLKNIKSIEKSMATLLTSLKDNNYKDTAIALKNIYDEVGINESLDNIFNAVVYIKPDIAKLDTTFLRPVKTFLKDYKKGEFNSVGYYNSLAELFSSVTLEKGESSYQNIKGNQRVSGFDSSFLSDWFQHFTNPVKAKIKIKEYLQDPSLSFSTLITKLIKNPIVENNIITDFEINEEALKEFNYFLYGGIKNKTSKQANEYKDFLQKNHSLAELLLYLNPNTKDPNFVSFNLPTPSDGSNMFGMNFPKTSINKAELEVIIKGDLEQIKNTRIYKDFWKVALQEIVDMDDAYNLMKDYITEKEDDEGNVIIKPNNLPLVKNYHYKLSKKNGKTVMVLGNVFKFNNFSWKDSENTYSLNDTIKGFSYITKQNIVKDGKATNLALTLKNKVAEMLYYTVEENQDYYADLEKKIDKKLLRPLGKKTENTTNFQHLVAEFSLNRFLFDVEFGNLIGGKLAQYGTLQEYFKRGKQTTAFGSRYSHKKQQNKFLSVTLDSIVIDTVNFEGVDTTDGISIISEANYLDRLERQGIVNKDKIVPQKNFYFSAAIDSTINKNIVHQVKNSEIVGKKSVFKGTDFETLINFIEEFEKKHGIFIQLNFSSAEKVGTRRSIKISDKSKNLILTDSIKKEIEDNTITMKYSNLRKQLDTPIHSVDEVNKLGTQLVREATSNIDENGEYKVGVSSLTGKELKTQLNSIRLANIKESNKQVIKELTKGEELTDKALSEYLIKEAIKSGLDSNFIKGLELNKKGELNLPLSFISSIKSKQFLTSLFTNKVTKQEVTGLHLAQAANIFIDGVKLNNQLTEEDINAITWFEDYDRTKGLAAANFEELGTTYAEVIIPAWTKSMINSDGTINIENMSEKARTMLGYRIPTEDKYSEYVFKVVGVFPQGYESAIVLPDDWVALSGSDFDIDSVFIQRFNLDKDNNVIPYLDKSPPKQNSRKARDNRILDIFIGVWSNKYSQEQIKESSNFKDVQKGSKPYLAENYHPFNNVDRLNMTSLLMSGRDLKGIFVNYVSLNKLANSINGIYLNTPVKLKLDNAFIKEHGLENIKDFYKEDFDEKTKVLSLRVIGDNLEGTNKNVTNRFITSFHAQLVANVLDIVKYPMSPNTNTNTAGVLSLLSSLGYPDYSFSFALIEQPIVKSYVESKYSFAIDSGRSMSAKSETLKKTQTNLQNLINKKSNIKSKRKDILITDVSAAKKKFGLSEAYYPSTKELKDSYERAKIYKELNLDQKINFLKSQLNIFYYYLELDNLAKEIDNLARITSYDKVGAGPDFNTTKDLTITYYELVDKDIFKTKEGKSIKDLIENEEGVYPTLPAFKKYSNEAAYELFSDFYLTEDDIISDLSLEIPKKHRNAFENYAIAQILRFNSFFRDLHTENAARILGIQTAHDEMDISGEPTEESIEKFSILPVANKLTLVKEQIADLSDSKYTLLNYIGHNKEISNHYDTISLYKTDQIDTLVHSFREMLKSENPYIKDLAYDLIRREYLVNGLTFGRNLTKFTPVDLFYTKGEYDLDIDIADTLRGFNTDSIGFVKDDLLIDFLRSNYKNSDLVPVINGTFWNKITTEGSFVVPIDTYNKFNEKLKTPILHYVEGEVDTLIKRTWIKDESNYVTNVVYTPVGKLEKYENGKTSYNSFNNLDFEVDPDIMFDTLSEDNFSHIFDKSVRGLVAKGWLDAATDAISEDLNISKEFLKARSKKDFETLSHSDLNNYILSAIKANNSLVDKLNKPLGTMTTEEMRTFIFNEIKTKFVDDASKLYTPTKTVEQLSQEELRTALINLYTYRGAKITFFKEAIKNINNVEDILDNSIAKEKLIRLLTSLLVFIDSYQDFEELRYYKDSNNKNLSKEQQSINNVIIKIQQTKPIEDELKIFYDKIIYDFYKATYFRTTTNPEALNAEDKDAYFKKIFDDNYSDITSYSAQLDTPYAISDTFITAALKSIKEGVEEKKAESYQLKKQWADVNRIIKERNITTERLFEKDTEGQKTGKWDFAYMKSEIPEMYSFITSLNTMVASNVEGSKKSFINGGLIPAYALDGRSKKVRILEDLLSYYDEDVDTQLTLEDRKGTTLKNVPFKGLSIIKRKETIPIDKPFKDEKTPAYTMRVLEDISIKWGKNFKSLDEVVAYNKRIDAYNSKIVDQFNHGNNISYDLELIMPRFIEEFSSSAARRKNLMELRLLINHLKSSQFTPAGKSKILSKLSMLKGKPVERSVDGTVSNTVKTLEWLLDNEYYEDRNRSSDTATKYGRVLRNYSSLRGLGLNLFSGINNVAYGELMTKIEAWAKDDFDTKTWRKSGKLYVGEGGSGMSSYIVDTKNEDGSASTKQSAFINFFDVLFRQNEVPERFKQGAKERQAQSDLGRIISKNSSIYLFNNIGEHYMQNRLLLAMALSHKVINGKIVSSKEFIESRLKVVDGDIETMKKLVKENKEITKKAKEEFENHPSIYEAIDFENGFLEFERAGISNKEVGKFKDKVIRKNHKLHGIYNQEDQNLLSSIEIGRHALMFRKWARPGWVKRFGTKMGKDAGYNEFTQRRDKGTYTSLWHFMTAKQTKKDDANERYETLGQAAIKVFMNDYLKYLTNIRTHYGSLNMEERMRVSSALSEITSMFVTVALLGLVRGMGEDDDEFKDSMAYNMLVYQLDRLKTETLTYFPGYGWLNEGLKLAATPTATFSTVTLLYKLAEASLYMATGNEKAVYRGGLYRGKYKASIYGAKLLPLYTQYLRFMYLKKHNRAFKLLG